jgi:hypothetical protein
MQKLFEMCWDWVLFALLGVMFLLALLYCLPVCAAHASRNVGVVAIPLAPVWPPLKPAWARHIDDFIAFPFSDKHDEKQDLKAVCTIPPKLWHGLHLNTCTVAEDKTIVCSYKIVANFGSADGDSLGTWMGLIWVQRMNCKGAFIPRLAEFAPPEGLEGAADPGTEAKL